MWAIGIKTGKSPLHLSNPPGHVNPVLTAAHVTDVPALFVADPFMIRRPDGWFMFFEVMNGDTRRGEIAAATSADGLVWNYLRVVLREKHHLSYPSIFESHGETFMIPETRRLGRVLVYRSVGFPFDWRLHTELTEMEGADPSIFHHAGRLWMFICSEGHQTLRLFSSGSNESGAPEGGALGGPWIEHPASPVVRNDAGRARPAGRVIVDGPRIVRFAQDCRADYGVCVRAFEVTELTETSYAEREYAESPVLAPSGSGWDGRRAHHIDAHRLGWESWIACVDGNSVHEPGSDDLNPAA